MHRVKHADTRYPWLTISEIRPLKGSWPFQAPDTGVIAQVCCRRHAQRQAHCTLRVARPVDWQCDTDINQHFYADAQITRHVQNVCSKTAGLHVALHESRKDVMHNV